MNVKTPTYTDTITKKSGQDDEDSEVVMLSLENGNASDFILQSSASMRNDLVRMYSILNRRKIAHRIQRLQLAAGKQASYTRTRS